jgi:hypothetical protein
MPFGADLTGGHSTAIPFQINNEIAIGRIAHFHEENNLGFENKNRKGHPSRAAAHAVVSYCKRYCPQACANMDEITRLRIFRLLAPILCAAKEDATRNGFRFVGQHADVVTPDQDHWPFLVFEKPRPKAAPQ